MPDGRTVQVGVADAVFAENGLPMTTIIERAKLFRRIPFEQGANTQEAMDGAGFVYLLHRAAGIPVPRDINSLMKAGIGVAAGVWRPGDVIFFSGFDPDEPWVGLLLDDGQTYLAATPAGGVSVGLVEQMRNWKIVAVRRFS